MNSGFATSYKVLFSAFMMLNVMLFDGDSAEAFAGYRGFTDRHMTDYIRTSRRTITIDYGLGGHVQGTVRNLVHIIDRRKRVVINGPCQSACTLFISLGSKNVCITRRAELWFHQATYSSGRRSGYWTGAMMKLYPAKIRRYLKKKGGLHRKWIVLKGKRLRRLFPHTC